MKSPVLKFILLFALIALSCRDAPKSEKDSLSNKTVYNLEGQAIDIDSLELYIEKQMIAIKIPGCSFVIINDSQVAYHGVFGVADIADNSPVKASTLFEGASTSKPVFAYMVMLLVDEGKLDLDTPLVNYLDPEYQNIYNFDPRYELITARMVLSHTTGFPNWRGKGDLTISFDPGTNFSYSGEGYQFLVRTVESVLETDYDGLETYFQEKVAIPLGMKHSKFVQNEYNRNHKATPHNDGRPMEKKLWTAAEFNAASALHTEAIEFSNWIIALMEQKGLSESSFDQMFKDQVTVAEAPTLLSEEGAIAWTLGFAKYEQKGHIVHGHEGNNDGFNALFLMDREVKWAMIQFNNANEVYDFGYNLFGYLHKE